MTAYNEETFDNMHSEMHAQDEFIECTFTGTASCCNFYKATFTDCTFGEGFQGFQFRNCNLQQVDGVDGVDMHECLYITDAQWQERIQLERIRNPHLRLDP